jgi:hypothetical protein
MKNTAETSSLSPPSPPRPPLPTPKSKPVPRKGLLLDLGGKQAEFFVEKDRSISIAVYDAALKAQPPQHRSHHRHRRSPPAATVKIEFEKKGDLLVSKTKLPEGEGYQVVLQAKATPDAKTKNFRIKLLTLHLCRRLRQRRIRLHL